MKIENESFDYKGTMSYSKAISYNYDDFDDCYLRPSEIKKRINNYWKNFFEKNCDSVIYYGVRGYNSNMFTLNAIIIIKNIMYYVYITKTKQEIYYLEGY